MSHLHVEVWSPDPAAEAALTSIEDRTKIISRVIALLTAALRLEDEKAAIVTELKDLCEALKR